jgi:hypothetical protein
VSGCDGVLCGVVGLCCTLDCGARWDVAALLWGFPE